MRCAGRLALATALASSAGCALVREGRPPALPRPAAATDTGTPADGAIEIEAGARVGDDSFVNVPITLKAGLGPTTEGFLGFSPYTQVEDEDGTTAGIGNVVLGARFRVVEGTRERPWVAVQGALKFPTADPDRGLGSGELDAFLALALEQNVLGAGLVGFAQLDLLGDPEGESFDTGGTVAGAITVRIVPRWRAYLEIADSFVPDRDLEVILATSGLAFELGSGLVLDAGVAVGLSDDAPDLQVVFGLAQPLGG